MSMLYDEEDVNNYLTDVFNALTYTLIKHYDFSIKELIHFFELYEQESEYVIKVDFDSEEHFENFKKSAQTMYYKDMFGPY